MPLFRETEKKNVNIKNTGAEAQKMAEMTIWPVRNVCKASVQATISCVHSLIHLH